jgi:formylglycine-generating enzyme required for sulfatase activity
MSLGWVKSAALAVVALAGLTAVAARGDEAADWLKARQARFAAFQSAHPRPEADIARIKARRAALVAASAPMDPQALDRASTIWKTSDAPVELWDGPDLPEMIVVPAGEFTMGSPDSEANRNKNEGPRHRVRIAYSFAVGKYPVTLGEFARFVTDTGFDTGDSCFNFEPGAQPHAGSNFRQTGVDQTIDDPVVCMNEKSAEAYAAWLSKKTGHAYRLLSEAEFEYAARAGATSAFWWGDDAAAACAYANGADLDTKARFPKMAAADCHDGFAAFAPVGSFKPNAFGLYDMAGNAWSILADCWIDSYVGAPVDGSPNLSGPCTRRDLRGGPWLQASTSFRSAMRGSYAVGGHFIGHGFRVARTL